MTHAGNFIRPELRALKPGAELHCTYEILSVEYPAAVSGTMDRAQDLAAEHDCLVAFNDTIKIVTFRRNATATRGQADG